MAWSFVGATDLGSAHSGSRNVTAGNLLLAFYINGLHTDVPTLADGVNTWTKIGITFDDAANDNSATWWWALATTTANITLTVSNISGADEGMAILEYHSSVGVPANSLGPESRRQQATPVTDPDQVTSGLVSAPSSDGALLLSWVSNYNSGANTETAGTGFTDRFTGAGGNIIRLEEFIQSTAAAKTATWTVSVSTNYVTFAAFFTETVAAAEPDEIEAGRHMSTPLMGAHP